MKFNEDGTLTIDYPMLLTATALCYIDQGWSLICDVARAKDDRGSKGWRGKLRVTKGGSVPVTLFSSKVWFDRDEALDHVEKLSWAITCGEWNVEDKALAHAIVALARKRNLFNGPNIWNESYRVRVDVRKMEIVEA